MKPSFLLGSGALAAGLRPWQRSREEQSWWELGWRERVVQLQPYTWKGSVGRAREGWETFFLLSPFSPYHVWCLIYLMNLETVLCLIGKRVRKEREKKIRVAKPRTAWEDFISTPESCCPNPVLQQSSVVLVRRHQILVQLHASHLFACVSLHAGDITYVISLSWPAFILSSRDLKEYPLAGDSCYSSRKYFFPSLIKILPNT